MQYGKILWGVLLPRLEKGTLLAFNEQGPRKSAIPQYSVHSADLKIIPTILGPGSHILNFSEYSSLSHCKMHGVGSTKGCLEEVELTITLYLCRENQSPFKKKKIIPTNYMTCWISMM